MKETNVFYDVNKLPEEEGILFWGISMNRIGNAQSAKKCFEDLQWMDTKIAKTKGVGMVSWYGDYLYFQSEQPAKLLRDRYANLMLQHKNALLNTLAKDTSWIRKAFSFYTFGQVMLDNAEIFVPSLAKVVDLYKKDKKFQECVNFDTKENTHGLGDAEVMFILEEITAYYLAAKGKLDFNNRFVPGTESWILNMYPGKPLKSETYLFQQNPLRLSNPKNIYENAYYDLTGRKLYEFDRIDIDTFDF